MPIPGKGAFRLIGRVEGARQQRVEERQHQSPVVAPCSRRLIPGPAHAEPDGRRINRRPELVRHAKRIAD
jgi:hypothetical protein